MRYTEIELKQWENRLIEWESRLNEKERALREAQGNQKVIDSGPTQKVLTLTWDVTFLWEYVGERGWLGNTYKGVEVVEDIGFERFFNCENGVYSVNAEMLENQDELIKKFDIMILDAKICRSIEVMQDGQIVQIIAEVQNNVPRVELKVNTEEEEYCFRDFYAVFRYREIADCYIETQEGCLVD